MELPLGLTKPKFVELFRTFERYTEPFSVECVKESNHVFRIVSGDQVYFLKIHTKP